MVAGRSGNNEVESRRMELPDAFRLYGPKRNDGGDAGRQEAAEVLLAELQRLVGRLRVAPSLADDLVGTVALGVLRAEPGRRYPDVDESGVRAFLARSLTYALRSEFRKLSRRVETPVVGDIPAPSTYAPDYLAALSLAATAVDDARRIVDDIILPAAGAGVRGGREEFDRVLELIKAVAQGRTTRSAVISAEFDACRSNSKPDASRPLPIASMRGPVACVRGSQMQR